MRFAVIDERASIIVDGERAGEGGTRPTALIDVAQGEPRTSVGAAKPG